MARYLGRGHTLHQLERIAKVPTNPLPTGSKMKHKATIAVGNAANMLHASADQAMRSIKKHGAWRYPNNRIVRHEQTIINGKHYYDERDQDEPRRKIESNFFITLNSNQQFPKDDVAKYAAGMKAMEKTLTELSKDQTIKQYLTFGPKSAWYKDDRYDDVVESVEFTGRAETGELAQRLHVHIWLTVKHYSQLQIGMPQLQHAFKNIYNRNIDHEWNVGGFQQTRLESVRIAKYSRGLAQREFRSNPWRIKRLPYIQVKLLPTSDWAQVLQQYIQKGMGDDTSTIKRTALDASTTRPAAASAEV